MQNFKNGVVRALRHLNVADLDRIAGGFVTYYNGMFYTVTITSEDNLGFVYGYGEKQNVVFDEDKIYNMNLILAHAKSIDEFKSYVKTDAMQKCKMFEIAFNEEEFNLSLKSTPPFKDQEEYNAQNTCKCCVIL